MKKDIFSSLKFDVIDAATYDAIDAVELDTEDKILYSEELKSILKEEIAKKIASLPSMIAEQIDKRIKLEDYSSQISAQIQKLERKIDQDNFRAKYQLKEDLDRISKEMRVKYAELRNSWNSRERYTFGGFPLVGGLMVWSEATASTVMVSGNGYLANNTGILTFTLPASAVVGVSVRVAGLGSGGWKIAQNSGNVIHFGNSDTTTGINGSLASTNRRDAIELVCCVANNEWNVASSVGNITVV